MKLDDGVVLERIAARFLHQAQVFIAAHHVRDTFYELHAALFFVFERLFLDDPGNVNRAGSQPEQDRSRFG